MSDHKVNMSAYLEPKTYALLRQYAFGLDVSKSDILAIALDQLLSRWASEPNAVKSDMAKVLSTPENVIIRHKRDDNHTANWRARRLAAYRGADILHTVVNDLDCDNGEYERPPAALGMHKRQREEMTNLINTVLRMILLANDGNVSPSLVKAY